MNIRLLGDRILIEPKEELEKTASGIILNKSNQPDDFKTGTVVEVGPGKTDHGVLITSGLKKDDVVIYQYAKDITVDGKKYVLVQEPDVVMAI